MIDCSVNLIDLRDCQIATAERENDATIPNSSIQLEIFISLSPPYELFQQTIC